MADTGHDYSPADPVVAQYERWMYPQPVEDLGDPSIAKYVSSFRSLQGLSGFYWPAGKPKEDLDVLVAGCGTMAAAVYAHLYPQCRVVGIDISRSSLAHHDRLKQRHSLNNLTLHHLPVEQAGSLGREFDYVSCHGVLHHLPDPAAGLRALRDVLGRDGVAGIMLYGKYARAPLYWFQDLFRGIGLEQTPEGVAVVRETLEILLPDHPLRCYLRHATDLDSDAGLVDTFLHRRDVAYSAEDCARLVDEADMVFQGWDRNFWYYPDGMLAGVPSLWARIGALPEPQMWHAMEVLVGMLGRHFFYVCRRDRDPATYYRLWESPRLLEFVPVRGAQLAQRPGADGKPQWYMTAQQFPPVPVTAEQAAIFSQMDGRRAIGQCLAMARLPAAATPLVRDLFCLLWRTGFAMLRVPR